MLALLSSSGDHSFVREEPLPYSVQELHVDLRAEGQPGGQLHDYNDRHNGSWQEEPWCKDGPLVRPYRQDILLNCQKSEAKQGLGVS